MWAANDEASNFTNLGTFAAAGALTASTGIIHLWLVSRDYATKPAFSQDAKKSDATFTAAPGYPLARQSAANSRNGETMHRIMSVVLLFAVAAFIAVPAVVAEDQPHMQAALESLRQAKE